METTNLKISNHRALVSFNRRAAGDVPLCSGSGKVVLNYGSNGTMATCPGCGRAVHGSIVAGVR